MFTFVVWREKKSGGACHASGSSYLCKLISPGNLPTDYLVLLGILGGLVAISTLKSIHRQGLQLKSQTKILEKSADAAKDAGDAAKQNIELLMSKEEARIKVGVNKISPTWEDSAGNCATF